MLAPAFKLFQPHTKTLVFLRQGYALEVCSSVVRTRDGRSVVNVGDLEAAFRTTPQWTSAKMGLVYARYVPAAQNLEMRKRTE